MMPIIGKALSRASNLALVEIASVAKNRVRIPTGNHQRYDADITVAVIMAAPITPSMTNHFALHDAKYGPVSTFSCLISASEGLRVVSKVMVPTNMAVSKMPGNKPATNRRPMDSSVSTA